MSKYIKFMFYYTSVPCWSEDGTNMDWNSLKEFNVDYDDIARLASYSTCFDLTDLAVVDKKEEEWIQHLSDRLTEFAVYFKGKNQDVRVFVCGEDGGKTREITI